jgi:hypothetical protein
VHELVVAERVALPSPPEPARALVSQVVHAPQPNQTVNIGSLGISVMSPRCRG